MNFEDWIPIYPDIKDPNFSSIISEKREIQELASGPKAEETRSGLYKHQEAFVRYLRQYDRILNMQETGTGKTCPIMGLIDYAMEVGTIKRIYILEEGQTLCDEIKRQLLCYCPGRKKFMEDVKRRINERKDKKYRDKEREIERKERLKKEKLKNGEEPEEEKEEEEEEEEEEGFFGLVKADVTRSLSSILKVMTYGQFINMCVAMGASKYEEMSDCIIMCDESQHVRTDPVKVKEEKEKKKKQTEPKEKKTKEKKEPKAKTEYEIYEIQYHMKQRRSGGRPPVPPKQKIFDPLAKNKYRYLWDLFHKIERSKVIISTATPGINETREIAKQTNLILPLENQMAVNNKDLGITNWKYENFGYKQLATYFKGMVSFIKPSDTGLLVKSGEGDFPMEGENIKYSVLNEDEVTDDINVNTSTEDITIEAVQKKYLEIRPEYPELEEIEIKNDLEFHRVYMSDFQYGYYKEARAKRGKDEESEKKRKNTFFIAESRASILVFPDGSWEGELTSGVTNRGLGHYVTTHHKSYVLNRETAKYFIWKDNPLLSEKEKSDLPSLTLEDLSAKYTEFLRIETKASLNDLPGCSFTFCDYVTGPGIILLSLILEINGYERYDGSSRAFKTLDSSSGDICANKTETREISLKKKRRFGVISGDRIDSAKTANLLELFNSEDNVNGEYIQIIICSPMVREGLSVANVTRGHLITAQWHPAGMHQALSRFIRSNSHRNLLNYRLSINDKERIAVTVYKYTAMIEDEEEESFSDFRMYKRVETKDIVIRQLMRKMKQCAFDCYTNRIRNWTGIENSSACDYSACEYKCLDEHSEPMEIIDDTYDILYIKDDLEDELGDISKKLLNKPIVLPTKLKNGADLNHFAKYWIQNKIEKKEKLKDRFGNDAYLDTDGYYIYLQNNIPDINYDPALSFYSNLLITSKFNSFRNIVKEIKKDVNVNNLRDAMKEENKRLVEISLLNLHIDTKISLFETAIYDKHMKQLSDIDELLLYIYQDFYFEIPYPREAISKLSSILSYPEPKAGRKTIKKVVSIAKTKEIVNLTFMDKYSKSENICYIHILEILNTGTTAYDTSSKFMRANVKMRIYNPEEPYGWRDLTEYEIPIFVYLIRKIRQDQILKIVGRKRINGPSPKKSERLEEEYIGTILEDKVGSSFRIHDVSRYPYLTEDKDWRSLPRGKFCNHKSYVVELAVKLDMYIRNTYIVDEDIDSVKEALIEYKFDKKKKLDSYDDRTLRMILSFYRSKISASKICDIIREDFEERGRMMGVRSVPLSIIPSE